MPLISMAQNPLPTVQSSVNGDYIIPTGISSLKIEATGARGGTVQSNAKISSGGFPVRIIAEFPVGNFVCNSSSYLLKPGGKLRFIVGEAGANKTNATTYAAVYGGGGGGTAV